MADSTTYSSSQAVPRPTDRSSLMAYAYQAARRNGLSPTLFLRQMQQESGGNQFNPDGSVKTSGAGARGVMQIVPKYHPTVNTDDPYASIDYAAKLMANNLKAYGSVPAALAAYNGGSGAVQQLQAGQPYAETSAYLNNIMGNTGNAHLEQSELDSLRPAPTSRSSLRDLAPDQFGDPTLTPAEAAAVCGPAAAVAFSRSEGRYPTLKEATDTAKMVGWTPQGGMNGIQNEYALMQKMGIHARLSENPSQDDIVHDASVHNPVAISTPVHYYVADAYNPTTQQLHVGVTGQNRRGGSGWMTYDQIKGMDGGINGALFSTYLGGQNSSVADRTSDSNRDDWAQSSRSTLSPETVPTYPTDPYADPSADPSTSDNGNTTAGQTIPLAGEGSTMPGSPGGIASQQDYAAKKAKQEQADLMTYKSLTGSTPQTDGLLATAGINLIEPDTRSPFQAVLDPKNTTRYTAPDATAF